MSRAQRVLCDFCSNGRIDVGEAFCAECGSPTVWASHDDRVQWEVGQWRRTRTASREEDRRLSAVATLPRPERVPAPDSEVARKTAAMTSPAIDLVETAPRGPSLVARFRRLWTRLRGLFATPMRLPDGIAVKPSGPAVADPPAAAEPVPLFDPEPVPDAAPMAHAIGAAPARPVDGAPNPRKPRKPAQRPTNKDMLKNALDVLKKVEQRLENVETELAEIDEAVRTRRATDDAPEATL
jgi:ribosomal protein S27AE